ncbi:MAG: DUF6293 family protein [Nitrososphaerota archaeon]
MTISTKLSIDETLDSLRVHIAPLGFEVDRIVIPAWRMKADRVWLISHNKANEDEGKPFRTEVSKQLLKANIECKIEGADRTDLFDNLRVLRKIIQSEKRNSILVNVSVGSKIQSIACTMACMMFKDQVKIKPYYATPEIYTSIPKEQETMGVRQIIPLPDYKIELPSHDLIKCLEIVYSRKNGRITKRDLKDKALEIGLIHVEEKKNIEQSAYMALNKNLIEPLQVWNFIDIEKKGRSHIISITTDGQNALRFLSDGINE